MKSAWLFILLLLTSLSTYAYPEFIGYGYSSCLTCHVNGLGNGPLNDYGRALWSAEIASRALFPKRISDETIGEYSGFLGKTDLLPYWFRPHYKYRDIQITTGLKGPDEAHMNYKMQNDFGVTLSDQAAKYAAMITWGQVQANRQPRTEKYIAKEYYLRIEPKESWWVYVGLLERAFGIRNVDHSSFQRTYQGFNPKLNSSNGIGQSHGVIVHKVEEKWEAAGNIFIGNPHEDEDNRQKGFSATGEYEVGEHKRAGASFMDAKNEALQKDIMAVHYRQGFGHGHALLFEYGYLEDKPKSSDKVRGSYNLLQTNLNIVRGYNFKATIERYNQEFKASSPDNWRWGVGLLAFPIPRLELRVDFINGRAFYEGPAADDSWTMQGQVHVSL